ncbi:hypothetical protein BC832DRAFT_224145 [Gaertneriomyces semiglobifer]|nr:hypothetical protein BC832DRAFT_224145 [Gaertneriomyces semiglobifer]
MIVGRAARSLENGLSMGLVFWIFSGRAETVTGGMGAMIRQRQLYGLSAVKVEPRTGEFMIVGRAARSLENGLSMGLVFWIFSGRAETVTGGMGAMIRQRQLYGLSAVKVEPRTGEFMIVGRAARSLENGLSMGLVFWIFSGRAETVTCGMGAMIKHDRREGEPHFEPCHHRRNKLA